MASVAKRLLRAARPLGCALAALCAGAGAAAVAISTCSPPDTLEVTGDVRARRRRRREELGRRRLRQAPLGQRRRRFRVRPQLGNVNLVWQPQFTWSLSATVVGSLQGGERTEAGLSQAYLTFKPMRGGKLAFSARAGLMWPPVSLEHEGADWHVRDSITPSAINSWIGEEVRPVAVEGTLAATLGEHKLRATAAMMAANDTSGTLLTFRGWALHDRTTLAFRRQPLPPLDDEHRRISGALHPSAARRRTAASPTGPAIMPSSPGSRPCRSGSSCSATTIAPIPKRSNADLEWGWRTRFNNVGRGRRARRAAPSSRRRRWRAARAWVIVEERAGAGSTTASAPPSCWSRRPFGPVGLAARAEAFDTRNHGSAVGRRI